jgi:two-component system response regulator RegX3
MLHGGFMPRILVVDDEVIVLESLALILRHAGYDVTACSSPSEALRILGESGGDVVLTDMQMPDMNGLEVAHIATQLSSLCYVIILSVQALNTAFLPRLEVWMKPIHPQDLLGRLQELTALQRFESSPIPPKREKNYLDGRRSRPA